MTTCRVCNAAGPHRTLIAREMMQGTREEFPYFECTSCGTVQIVSPPEDLSRYYSDRYYAHTRLEGSVLGRWIQGQRDRHLLGLFSPTGVVLALLRPDPSMAQLQAVGLKLSHRILDVGCGNGSLLDRLAKAGFRRLLGVDPFIECNTVTPAGAPIRRMRLEDLDGTFDVSMFHHSLEHVPDPVATLRAAAARLAIGGICLVRIPTPSSEAWQVYRENWVQLDAPRHLVLPSRMGLTIMAESVGLRLERVVDDSGPFQFLGSELYRCGIPLSSRQAEERLKPRAVWCALWDPSSALYRTYAERARELNAEGRGDQIAAVFRKVA